MRQVDRRHADNGRGYPNAMIVAPALALFSCRIVQRKEHRQSWEHPTRLVFCSGPCLGLLSYCSGETVRVGSVQQCLRSDETASLEHGNLFASLLENWFVGKRSADVCCVHPYTLPSPVLSYVLNVQRPECALLSQCCYAPAVLIQANCKNASLKPERAQISCDAGWGPRSIITCLLRVAMQCHVCSFMFVGTNMP